MKKKNKHTGSNFDISFALDIPYEARVPLKTQVWQWRFEQYIKGNWVVDGSLLTEAEAELRFTTCPFSYEKHQGPWEVVK